MIWFIPEHQSGSDKPSIIQREYQWNSWIMLLYWYIYISTDINHIHMFLWIWVTRVHSFFIRNLALKWVLSFLAFRVLSFFAVSYPSAGWVILVWGWRNPTWGTSKCPFVASAGMFWDRGDGIISSDNSPPSKFFLLWHCYSQRSHFCPLKHQQTR